MDSFAPKANITKTADYRIPIKFNNLKNGTALANNLLPGILGFGHCESL